MSIHVEQPQIIYKSKYSIICDLVGHPKPASQAEEDYCQLVERQNESTSIFVQKKMLTSYLSRPYFKSKPVSFINRLKYLFNPDKFLTLP